MPVEAVALRARSGALPSAIDKLLADFDLRAAATALWEVVTEANHVVSSTRPWELAKAERAGDRQASERLDGVLAVLLEACSTIAIELTPFLPVAAERITAALIELDPQKGRTLFPKFDEVA